MKLPFRVFAALLVVGCFAGLSATPSTATPAAKSVILFSWDGVRRDVLNELLYWQPIAEPPVACPRQRFEPVMPTDCPAIGSKTCLPHLCEFQVVDMWHPFGKTLTRPQHAQMLSGYGPDITTIESNNGQARMPPDITIYERLDELLGFPVEKAHIGDKKFATRGIMKWAKKNGAIPKKRIIKRGIDRKTGNKAAFRAREVLDEIGSGNQFFMFVHLKASDWQAHKSGDWSESYRETIILADDRMGEVMDKVAEIGMTAATTIYVTTDHGFHGRTHNRRDVLTNVDTWMASSDHNLSTASLAAVTDTMPTILETMGVDAAAITAISPALAGVSLVQ